MQNKPLGKRLQIDKTNKRMVIIVAVASVLLVFAIMATRILIGEIGYTTRVLSAKDKAAYQLEQNSKNAEKLSREYRIFAESSTNVLSGSQNGTGPLDGSNPRITLDSLPNKYDFPGLISSIEKITAARGVKIEAIGGTDDEIASNQSKPSPDPEPIPINFTFDVASDYNAAKAVIADLQRSIRPFNINKISLTGSNKDMRMGVEVQTYFQPTKSIVIEKEEVK